MINKIHTYNSWGCGKKIYLSLLACIFALIIAIPPLSYSYALSLVNVMPKKPRVDNLLPAQLIKGWEDNEPKVTLLNFDSITPYWVYKWVLSATFANNVSSEGIDPYSNVSLMASNIAISHMRTSSAYKNTKGMFWWHTLHISLVIHIQIEWTAEEILIKYRELNAKQPG